MQLAEYVTFHERLGKNVQWLGDIPFSEYRRRFVWSLPHFRPYPVGPAQLRRLLRKGNLGAIAMTTTPARRLAPFVVCGGDYDLSRLQRMLNNSQPSLRD